jgi:hypothetical protein
MSATKAELLALAERVEALTGPCRETDAHISLVAINNGKTGSFANADKWIEAALQFHWSVAHYTASLDAAMTLVPEGWHTYFASEDRHSLRWSWALRGGYGVTVASPAATPALALTAAALRARSHGEPA